LFGMKGNQVMKSLRDPTPSGECTWCIALLLD